MTDPDDMDLNMTIGQIVGAVLLGLAIVLTIAGLSIGMFLFFTKLNGLC